MRYDLAMPRKRLLALAALTSPLALAAESIHRRAGVWIPVREAPPAAWIPAVYFVATVGCGGALAWLERRVRPALAPGRRRALEAVPVLALFLAPPLLHARELVLLALASGYLVLRLAAWRAPGDLAVAAVAMAGDLGIEAALVALGFYRYAHAAWGPLPLWLAPLWGGLALGLRRLLLPVTAAP